MTRYKGPNRFHAILPMTRAANTAAAAMRISPTMPENVGPPRPSFKYSIKCLPTVCFDGLQGAA